MSTFKRIEQRVKKLNSSLLGDFGPEIGVAPFGSGIQFHLVSACGHTYRAPVMNEDEALLWLTGFERGVGFALDAVATTCEMLNPKE